MDSQIASAPSPLAVIPAYLRLKNAASYLGISEQLLLKLHRKGEGPPRIRKGRAVLYPVKSLDAWMERDREPANWQKP